MHLKTNDENQLMNSHSPRLWSIIEIYSTCAQHAELQVLKVTSDESMAMARELAKKEGLLVGISAGGAVHVSCYLEASLSSPGVLYFLGH